MVKLCQILTTFIKNFNTAEWLDSDSIRRLLEIQPYDLKFFLFCIFQLILFCCMFLLNILFQNLEHVFLLPTYSPAYTFFIYPWPILINSYLSLKIICEAVSLCIFKFSIGSRALRFRKKRYNSIKFISFVKNHPVQV